MRPRALCPRERRERPRRAFLSPHPVLPCIQVSEVLARRSWAINLPEAYQSINFRQSQQPCSWFYSYLQMRNQGLERSGCGPGLHSSHWSPNPRIFPLHQAALLTSTLSFHSFIFPSLIWWSLKRGLWDP